MTRHNPGFPTRRDVLAAGLGLVAASCPALAREEETMVRDLYREGDGLTPLAAQLSGSRILLKGFMAPPLRANATFFVLSEQPLAICPFCEESADWPEGIIPVYTQRQFRIKPFWERIGVTGELMLGEFIDPDTGFLSLMRIDKAVIEA